MFSPSTIYQVLTELTVKTGVVTRSADGAVGETLDVEVVLAHQP